MHIARTTSLAIAGALASALACMQPGWSETAPDPAGTIHAFHIGNSLTFGVLSFPHAKEILSTDTRPYVFGEQVLWGAPLSKIVEQQNAPSVKSDAFGIYPHALSTFTWDVVTLQPSFAVMEGPGGDLAMSVQLGTLVLTKSPQAQIYIYETWPSIGAKAAPGTYARMWNRIYTPGAWDKALYSGDYCSKLVMAIRAQLSSAKPVRLLPVGHVLAALDLQAKAGTLPGVPGIETLYGDGTHLGEIGNFIAICTWYAVLRGETPRHIAPALIPHAVTASLATIIEETAWTVVTGEPLTGVSP